ncbi:MAG TPA: ABC transporter permease, partial [Eubacterium sp.]|nr:ABC transporter permease [Eubacterium sp.]
MRNPLIKRLPKELLGDFKKYMIMFLFLILMIAMGAGDLVASFSMNRSFDETKEKYNLEDGNFRLYDKASDKFIENINKKGVKVYENFYKELEEFDDDDGKADATVRIFKNRTEINKVCIMEGRLPKA